MVRGENSIKFQPILKANIRASEAKITLKIHEDYLNRSKLKVLLWPFTSCDTGQRGAPLLHAALINSFIVNATPVTFIDRSRN